MTRLVLPLDVLLIVIHYADQSALCELSKTCRLVSSHALQQLWRMPYITNITSLLQLSNTLLISKPQHPYKDWISGLALHMNQIPTYQPISDYISTALAQLGLELLSLQQIDILDDDSLSFERFMCSQLEQGIAELHIYQCTPKVIGGILNAIQVKEHPHLRTLCIYDCHLTDNRVINLVRYCPSLRTLKLDKCGCLSDKSMIEVAKNCSELYTLVVTLPSNIIQSNTITVKTIEALEMHCLSLNQFVCGGQIRISEYIETRLQEKHFNTTNMYSPPWM